MANAAPLLVRDEPTDLSPRLALLLKSPSFDTELEELLFFMRLGTDARRVLLPRLAAFLESRELLLDAPEWEEPLDTVWLEESLFTRDLLVPPLEAMLFDRASWRELVLSLLDRVVPELTDALRVLLPRLAAFLESRELLLGAPEWEEPLDTVWLEESLFTRDLLVPLLESMGLESTITGALLGGGVQPLFFPLFDRASRRELALRGTEQMVPALLRGIELSIPALLRGIELSVSDLLI